MTNFVTAAISKSPVNNPQTGLPHLVRSAGSYIPGYCLTDSSAREFLNAVVWVERLKEELPEGVWHPAGICRYWQGILPHGCPDGIQGVALKKDVPERLISWADGSHQRELVADFPLVRTRVISLITGPLGEDTVVWTWYPGHFTPFVPVTPDTPVKDVPGNATVKLRWAS